MLVSLSTILLWISWVIVILLEEEAGEKAQLLSIFIKTKNYSVFRLLLLKLVRFSGLYSIDSGVKFKVLSCSITSSVYPI